MNKFSSGDLIKIIKQPKNQCFYVVGEVGFIDEILDGDFVRIQTLRLDGTCGGCGSVSFDCLEPEHGQYWIEAKRKHDERIEKMMNESKDFTQHINDGIAKIAEKHGLSVTEVEEISSEIRHLYP